jgi:hypothetical protein
VNRADYWWQMSCWNALSHSQQERLVKWGNLPLGYEPEGKECDQGAVVAIELEIDASPGPRFYCLPCAIEYLLASRVAIVKGRA